MTRESADSQIPNENNENADQNILHVQEHFDALRARNAVDYIVKAIMQRSLKRDATGKVAQRSKYGWRFMGSYLVGWDFVESQSTAEGYGKGFFKGDHTNSIANLVAVLDRVKNNIASGYRVKTKKGYRGLGDVPVPTSAQMLEAFQILNRLSADELQLLGLPSYCQHPLLQQAYINLAITPVEPGQTVPEIYRMIYQLSLRKPKKSEVTPPLDETVHQIVEQLQQYADQPQTNEQSQTLKDNIHNSLENLLVQAREGQTRFDSLDEISVHVRKRLKDKPEKTHQKVMNALKRLLLQAGTGQTRFLALDDQKRYIQNYLNAAFVDHLTDTVCTNNTLMHRFPIYLKGTTQEMTGVFPLPKPNDDPRRGYLSETLLSLKGVGFLASPIDDLFLELPTRTVMRVIGHFYIRQNKSNIAPGNGYQGFDLETHEKMRNVIEDEVRIPFTVETTGIGGTYSMIVQVLNRALLSDVKGLREDYFPVAHGLLVDQDNVQQRILSPVTSHSFVQLCHVQTLAKAMEASIYSADIPDYGTFSNHDPRGAGSHSHFDILRAAANAPLMARIQAIANTGIDPQSYIFAVLSRIEQQCILDEAKTLLDGYPFSSFAATSWLESKLIEPYEEHNKDATTKSQTVQKARLTIVETFLTEGAYLKAFKHLEQLHDDLDVAQGSHWIKRYREQLELRRSNPDYVSNNPAQNDEEFNVISGQILARYEICLARYFAIFDIEKEKKNQDKLFGFFDDTVLTRAALVKKAWEHLTRAQQHLTVRLMKYHIVDEISQATLHPHYQLLAQIYFYRAKLLIWYPALLPPENDWYQPPIQPSASESFSLDQASRVRLFLLERARVYAACDGDKALYVISTAYQCRVWLMTAFTMEKDVLAFENKGSFSKQQCLDWAKKLRNRAIVQYAPIGERCYHAIKEKSGLTGSAAVQNYGSCSVESICAIREAIDGDDPRYDFDTKVLYLDMQYLAVRRQHVDENDPTNSQGIYLFGPQSSNLFLIRGLYYLCTDEASEFSKNSERGSKSAQNSESLNTSQWDRKLLRCYRLFSYAWAISGDGCAFSPGGDPNIQRRIIRDVEKAQSHGIEQKITNPHATTVWNLYPYRITEVAALGKIFSAACAAIRCHTAKDREDRLECRRETERLLCSLPCGSSAPKNSDDAPSREASYGQARLNGHLINYITQCSKAIRQTAVDSGNNKAEGKEIKDIRDQLIETLFSFQAL